MDLMTRIQNASTESVMWEARTDQNSLRERIEILPGKFIDKCYQDYILGDINPQIHLTISVYLKGTYDEGVKKIIHPLDLLINGEVILKVENGEVGIIVAPVKAIQRRRAVRKVLDLWGKISNWGRIGRVGSMRWSGGGALRLCGVMCSAVDVCGKAKDGVASVRAATTVTATEGDFPHDLDLFKVAS
ncbi:hypothetical protein RJ641_024237 [Dillenia turbinata]|uniref:Uncharacterized protein n=1 Tax=Dillenia turbinata TaxID=194707 RepID=A0AAN8UDS7_9MAGN